LCAKDVQAREQQLMKKDFSSPDGGGEMKGVKQSYIDLGPYRVSKWEFQPGWKWSVDIKPMMGTEWHEDPHLMYIISGRQKVQMKDGTEIEYGPGDIVLIPPYHDGWTLGDEPAVMLDFGMLL
jgi:uncharacterized cupin superfamily protein